MRLTLLAVLAALASPPPAWAGAATAKHKTAGSCVFPRSCADYDAAVDLAKRRCEALRSTWSDSLCPTANLVATCTMGWGGGSCQTRFYRPMTRKEAKRLCDDSHGVFR